MAASVWSGNLRLSLVLVPVKLYPASQEGRISFRQIHAPSGQPVRNIKGVHDDDGAFVEIRDEEIIKGYEHQKGSHVLIRPEEIDELKLEAKHTIDMVRFVDGSDIDSRYYEKPYYVLPDGDSADEGYAVIRDALKQSGKVAVGQLVMNGREHLVGIEPHGRGLVLSILRYADELRDAETYFERVTAEPAADAIALGKQLVEGMSGPFKPETLRDEYQEALKELLQAKVEQRAPEIAATPDGKPPTVVNIMAALKQSVQTKGGVKPRDLVRKRNGKTPAVPSVAKPRSRPRERRSVN